MAIYKLQDLLTKHNVAENQVTSFGSEQSIQNSIDRLAKEEESESAGQTIANAFRGGVDQIKKGFSQGKLGEGNSPLSLVEGGLNIGAGIVNAATAPLAPIFKPIGEGIEKVADKISDNPNVQKFAMSKAGEVTSRVAEDVVNATTIAGAVTGVKSTPVVASKVAGVAKNMATKVGTVTSKVKGLAPDSATIMNRVARLKPTDANKFEKLSGGKTHGQYLSETGNFGTPDKIITNEASKFTQSLADKKAALADLPGVYKEGAVTDALDMLVEKAKSESSPNVKSPYLDQVLELQRKNNETGLSMLEAENVKSLLESKVKLGYNKMMSPEKVNQATNIDNFIREWQVKKAKELGFDNISELNKQTQLSKFIIDKLGDQVVGKNGLNGVNLTDWIVLSGGNPTAVAGFLTKKFFSSKGVQSKIAELLNKGEVKGQIKAKITPSKQKSQPLLKKSQEKASTNDTTSKVKVKGITQASKKTKTIQKMQAKVNTKLYPKKYDVKKGSATWQQKIRDANRKIDSQSEGIELSRTRVAKKKKAVEDALNKKKSNGKT